MSRDTKFFIITVARTLANHNCSSTKESTEKNMDKDTRKWKSCIHRKHSSFEKIKDWKQIYNELKQKRLIAEKGRKRARTSNKK
jgi:hypothetical protein